MEVFFLGDELMDSVCLDLGVVDAKLVNDLFCSLLLRFEDGFLGLGCGLSLGRGRLSFGLFDQL